MQNYNSTKIKIRKFTKLYINLKFHQIKIRQMQKFADPPNLTATKFTRYTVCPCKIKVAS